MWSRRRLWGTAVVLVAAVVSLVVTLNKEAIDSYACIKKIEWSVDNPAELTDLELGHLVGRWASSAPVAVRCFTYFRTDTNAVSLAHHP